MSNKCPKCGNPVVSEYTKIANFTCGSSINAHGQFFESIDCGKNQLTQAKAELAAKDAEIERLRKIADAAEWRNNSTTPTCPVCGQYQFGGHAPDCLYSEED